MTDKELIQNIQKGNTDLLNLIVEKYYDDIYRFCLYLTGNEIESYDITQTVFLKFIKYIDSYKHKNLKGYLLIIARNVCRDFWAHGNKTAVHYDNEQIEVATTDNKMEEVENHILLCELLQKLSEEQREVIILHVYEDMKFKDIAYLTRCNVSTVKSRYQSGIVHMKNNAKKEGINIEN